jgi:hypothetical protein
LNITLPSLDREFTGESRLADTRLAHQQQHPSSARESVLQASSQDGYFPLSPDKDILGQTDAAPFSRTVHRVISPAKHLKSIRLSP